MGRQSVLSDLRTPCTTAFYAARPIYVGDVLRAIVSTHSPREVWPVRVSELLRLCPDGPFLPFALDFRPPDPHLALRVFCMLTWASSR